MARMCPVGVEGFRLRSVAMRPGIPGGFAKAADEDRLCANYASEGRGLPVVSTGYRQGLLPFYPTTAISSWTPRMLRTRLRWSTRMGRLMSPRPFASPRVSKYPWSLQRLLVPKGCSTRLFRDLTCSGFARTLCGLSSRRLSCPHRVILRCPLLRVHCALKGHP
jgi:hypothetical protein